MLIDIGSKKTNVNRSGKVVGRGKIFQVKKQKEYRKGVKTSFFKAAREWFAQI